MPKTEAVPTRAPRGTRPVAAAFFAALDSVPEASREAIARAAQIIIRDELKLRRDKSRAAAAKLKATTAAAARMATQSARPRSAPRPAAVKSAAKPRTSRRRPAAAP